MIALMKRILTAAGTRRRRIELAFVFSFLKSLLSKAPILLAFFVLSLFYAGHMTLSACFVCAGAMLLCVALQAVLQHAADRLQSAAGFWVFSDLRLALGAHLRRLPMGYFTEGNIGKISSVLASDMVFIEENCMPVLADLMSDLFAEGILAAFLLCFHPWLGLTALAVLGAAALVARGMKKEALRDSAARQEQNEHLTSAVVEFIEGIGVSKTYHLLGERSKELTENFAASCETSLRFEKNHAPWQRRLQAIFGVGAACVAAVTLLLSDAGAMSAPYAVGVLLFVFDLFGPIKAFYTQATRLTVMNSCMDRIEALFAEPELPDAGQEHIPSSSQAPEIAFEAVRFSYGEKEVLHGLSFAVERGHMLALAGPSGGGKSTVASLLARFWDVDGGRVCVRGKDVRRVPLQELMGLISMVFQRVYLFQDTIYNNICMGRPGASRDEVVEAAKKARCHEFITALPQGYDTVVGEGGATLSGGEKQRISIARCILKDALIVLLDEATASVDADNERAIQEALSELCRGKTLLVIAHRLNTIRQADEILVLQEGQIAERGRHEALLAQNGIYRRFAEAQENAPEWNQKA